jgi:hypothetical protein
MRSGDGAGSTTPASSPSHWEATVAIVALTADYALVAAGLRLGPNWLLPLLVIALFVPMRLSRRLGRPDLTHGFAIALAALTTAAVGGGVGVLILGS